MDGTILLADDDRGIRTVLTQALSRAGCRVHATGSLSQLLRWAEEGRGDLVVTDVMMPDGNGLDLVPALTRARPDLPVIVISAQNSIVTAIRATEAAVFDYLPKPFDLPDLMARVRAGLVRQPRRGGPAPEPVPSPAGAPAPADPAALLIGHAPAMQALFRSVARVVGTDLPVLITGEAGSGRTTLARALHDLGERRAAPLVRLTAADAAGDAGALAARVADAAGGTLLIEDAAAWDLAAQARLAGLIEAAAGAVAAASDDGRVGDGGAARSLSPRLIATTGPDPARDAAEGRLRPDLFYRLAGVTLESPPLRARLDDLPALARALADRAGVAVQLSDDAVAFLRAHPFPGNLRELDNLLRRLALSATGPIGAAEVAAALRTGGPVAGAGAPDPVGGPLAEAVEHHLQRYFNLHGDQLPPPGLHERILREIERPLIQIALDACGGNQLRCADLLGINRNTLRKKVSALNIEVTRRRRVM